MLTETGTFTHGIIHDGKIHREFTLDEEVGRHTFLVANDATLDFGRLAGDEKAKPPVPADEAYYAACILAARLKVQGLAKVTADMVEELSKADTQQLLRLGSRLEQRRELFRKETERAAQGPAGAHEAGVPGKRSPGKKR